MTSLTPALTQSLTPLQNMVMAYRYDEMVINLLLATALGVVIALLYQRTHRGYAYSRSFAITVLFVTVICAVVMMVIGNSLARAFALVGALSIVRFRTVIRDTKDTAFIFAGLALGMAAGTSNYFLALLAAGVITALALLTHRYGFSARDRGDLVLHFFVSDSSAEGDYQRVLAAHTRHFQLLQMDAAGDGRGQHLSFDIRLKSGQTPTQLSTALATLAGISEISVIAVSADQDA